MPIYEYEGQQYDIADTDPARAKVKILNYLDSQKEPEFVAAPAVPETGFIPSVKRGALGLQSLVADVAPAMAGRVAEKLGIQGAGEYANRQMQEAAQAQQRIQELYPAAVPSYTDIKGVGDLYNYVVESVGELIPSMIPSILTGGVAGVAGRGAVVAAEQAARQASMEAAKKTLVSYSGSKLTQEQLLNLAKQDALKAGQDAARKVALKYEASGALAGSAVQNIPEVYQNIAQETGKEDLGAALVFGSFNAALDAITPLTLLRKAKGAGLTENELIGAWYKRGAKGLGTGFLTEGGTELVQEMSSAAAEKFVDQHKEFFTPQNFERFINAGLKGGLGGGVASGATNVAFGQKEPRKPSEGVTPTGEGEITKPAETMAKPTISKEEALAKVAAATKKKEVPSDKQPDVAASGVSAAVPGGPDAVNAARTVAGLNVDSMVDFGGAPDETQAGEGEQPSSLIPESKPAPQAAVAAAKAKQDADVVAQETATEPVDFLTWIENKGISLSDGSLDWPALEEQYKAEIGQAPAESKEVVTEDVLGADQQEAEAKKVVDEEVKKDLEQAAAEEKPAEEAPAEEPTKGFTKPFRQEEPPKTQTTWEGEPAFAPDTERRFIEPIKTEEDLYAKAIAKREENKKIAEAEKAAEPTLEEKVKIQEELDKVKAATKSLIAEDKDAKKLYKGLSKESKAKVDKIVEKYNALKEFREAKPMRKRKEQQPPGIVYQPKDYAKLVKQEKKEAKAAAEAPATPKRMSLLEERLADFRKTKSQYKDAEGNISYYLEGLEGLRGGTTIDLIANLMEGDLRGALEEIAKNTSGEFTKLDNLVAKRLLESDTLPTLKVVPGSEIEGKLGRYDAATDIAYINEDAMTSHTVLHETLHGFTLATIKAHKEGIKFNQGVKNLEELYKHLKDNYPELADQYGMENLVEFVSEVMSNPAFQEQLNAIPYKRGNLVINAFVDFVKSILNMLRISPGSDFTALGYALISTESILTEGRNLEVTNPPPASAALKSDVKAEKEPLKPELRGIDSAEEWIKSIPGQAPPKVKTVREAFTSVKGAKELARLFQNERYPIKNWEDLLSLANKITHSGDSQNNIYTQISLATGRAEDEFLVKMYNPSNALYKAIGKYTEQRGIGEEQALKELQAVFIALHEGERRHAKYLMTVPLTAEAAMQRDAIMDLVRSAEIDEDTARALRAKLEELVANNKQFKGFGQDSEPSSFPLEEDSDYYNVAGIRPAVREETLAKYYAPNKEIIDELRTSLQDVHKATIDLNKKANYWSQPVSNIVAFYGFENYVPLKGRPGGKESKADELLNFDGTYNGRELQEATYQYEGRVSESDNPLLQTLADGVRAALRAGRGGTHTYTDANGNTVSEQYGITLAIKNAIEQKLLGGHKVATIAFKDRYKVDAVEALKRKGETTFFHYNPDGSIDIYAIHDPKLREAIRRTYRTSQPLIDAANHLTSFLGQLHTRYNVAFAPMNFVRDTLTNAFTMGAEMGPGAVGAIASKVTQGGISRAFKVAKLYRDGEFTKIEQLAKNDPYIKAMYEYIQLGGKVAYLQGIGVESQFVQMQKDLGRSKIATSKAQIDGVIDLWTNSFEFASRTAAYQVAKENFMNGPEQLSEREAQVKAAGYVKNLANFEQVGQWGRGLGAIFMFFRPSATGAVRAIEALVPLFRNIDAALTNLPESVRNDPQAVAAFRKNMMDKRAAAQRMLMSLAGAGAAIYLMAMTMAQDDEDGRNKVATDDMARWSRYARFHIPGTDVIFQIPWGFGLGAFASMGAQIMSFGLGNSSLKDTFNNVKDIGFDSFLPLPISRINAFDNPAAWAMDSVTPSLFRPFFEYAMNMDGLGREIYNNRQTRSGDAYTGGDNIPELYKEAAKMLANITNGAVDWSPNTMYFFANNYADGLTRLIHNSYNIGMVGTGQKEFNPKTDTLAFDSFFGAKSNFDAREFSKFENQIKDKERKINMFKNDPERYAAYISEHPYDQGLVDLYNRGVNGDLKKAREIANYYRSVPNLSPKERKIMLDNVKEQQNLIKRHLISIFKAYDEL